MIIMGCGHRSSFGVFVYDALLGPRRTWFSLCCRRVFCPGPSGCVVVCELSSGPRAWILITEGAGVFSYPIQSDAALTGGSILRSDRGFISEPSLLEVQHRHLRYQASERKTVLLLPPLTAAALFLLGLCIFGCWFANDIAKMRLLTHNMLSCNIKGVTKGFPLELEVERFVTKEVPFNPDFLKHIFSKIDWKALHDASQKMGVAGLPEQADVNMLEDDDFLRKFHHALLELHVEEGALICPETGRRFPVSKGIPNMLLHEDEV